MTTGASPTIPPLHELAPERFATVHSLIPESSIHCEIGATLDGLCRGRVWVDRTDHPSTALVWGQSHNGFLLGEPTEEGLSQLRQLLAGTIWPWGRQIGAVQWCLRFSSAWEPLLMDALAPAHPVADEQLCLRYASDAPPTLSPLQEGYALAPVDAAFLDRPWRHREALDDWIRDCWASTQTYLRYGWGYAVVRGDEIVSHCMAEYPSAGLVEIGVDTSEPFRRQGWATRVGHACVHASMARGAKVQWHCWRSNVASKRLALKIGLSPLCRYPVLFAWYHPIDQLVVNGNVRLWAGHPGAAIPWYERALARAEREPQLCSDSRLLGDTTIAAAVYVNIARAYGRTGQPEPALTLLRRAVRQGWRNVAEIKAEEDMATVWRLAEWHALERGIASLQ